MVQTQQLRELKEKFLQSGGILLRKGTSDTGDPVTLHRKRGMADFETRLTFTSEKLRNKNFDYLTRKQKQFFRSDE